MRPPFLALAQLLCLASVGAVLRPSLATNPARLLGQVAELVLRSRLRTCDSCRVDVGVDPASIMCVYTSLSLLFALPPPPLSSTQHCLSPDRRTFHTHASRRSGGVSSVRVSGERWCTPMGLACGALDIEVGATAIDLGALVTERRIVIKRPALGVATLRFTAADWDAFLLHPKMAECVERKRGSDGSSAPSAVGFRRAGGTRLHLADASGRSGFVSFPTRFDGEPCHAELSQRADGSVECTARPMAPAEADPANGAAQRCGPWLAELFADLVLDLDGCELTFDKLRLEQGTVETAELVLQLDVCVRKFPSLDINF